MTHSPRWLAAVSMVGWTGSLGAHLLAYLGLAGAPRPPVHRLGPTTVSFQVKAASPSSPPTAPQPPPPPPERKREPKVQGPRPKAVEVPPAAPEPSAPLEPVDLTGVTLTGDGQGPGWASVVGNGKSLTEPIRSPKAASQETRLARTGPEIGRPAAALRRPAAPEMVPVANLGRRPVPPALDGVLRSNYPAEARRQGVSGSAVVSARIDPDGQVRMVQVRTESAPGFGQACCSTVRGSVWSAPLDQSGKPVATQISYTCRFVVGS